jgi:hypothetical protein
MLHWVLIAGLMAGPLATSTEHPAQPVGQDPTVCTVGTQAPVRWTPSTGTVPLTAASPSTGDLRQRVTYETSAGKVREFEFLYGSASRASNIDLTQRNNVDNTPNIQYPDGPGLAINNGWAFVTFRWPLIWMESIQAGSIGTTSVMQTTTDRVDLFLVLNAKDVANADPITRPAACPRDAKLFIRVLGVEGSICLQVPKESKAVLRSYALQRDATGHVTSTTPMTFTVEGKSTQELPLAIVRKDGRIVVGANASEQERFLGKVLTCAQLQGLYDVP